MCEFRELFLSVRTSTYSAKVFGYSLVIYAKQVYRGLVTLRFVERSQVIFCKDLLGKCRFAVLWVLASSSVKSGARTGYYVEFSIYPNAGENAF